MKFVSSLCATIMTATLLAAGSDGPHVSLDPGAIGDPPVTAWPTFNGDYSGQRYSTLTQIEPANVNQLARQWVFKITDVGAQRGAPVPVIKCTPLLVDGVLYITIPDHVWALDARTGKEIWHYDWVGSRRAPRRPARRRHLEVERLFPHARQLARRARCEYRPRTVERRITPTRANSTSPPPRPWW